ncbi:MAG TPA: hypothetical protein VFC46_04395 [Humisphaera sp.]|nr:hypothetical protein [Humisphaera sp.]
MRAADPTNQAVLTGLKASAGTAAAVAAPEFLPGEIAAGTAGKYVAKPIASGFGAGVSSLATGSTPKEALETGASTAFAGSLLEGITTGASKLLQSGILGDGLANYFTPTGKGGALVPKDSLRDLQRIHEAIGIKPSDLNVGLGATSADDAWNLPGRSILKAGIKPADLEGLTPFEQAEKLKPIWSQAGKDVASAADAATQKGVTFDGAKRLTQVIGNMLDPEGPKALAMVNDTAEQLGIKDWRKMTPNEALELKQTLWDRLPTRFRGPVYGALTQDMNKAVPEMVPANLKYSELRTAMDAVQNSAEKYVSRATPTKFDQMLTLLKQHPVLAGSVGLGGVPAVVGGTVQAYKSLKDLIGN